MERVRRVLQRAVDAGLTPVAVAGVLTRGGDRAVEAAGAGDRDTVFDIASLTKVVGTTASLMVLTDRGDLDPGDGLATFLPGVDPSITLEHLLTHRAGLLPWQPLYLALPVSRRNSAGVVELIGSLPPAGPVGSARRYSDLGMTLLGAVIEQVTGKPLDAAIAALVTGPLGLTATGYRPAGAPEAETPEAETGGRPPASDARVAATSAGDIVEQRMVATGEPYPVLVADTGLHRPRAHRLRGEVNDGNAFHALGGVAGHAGIFSTVDDLLTFGASLSDTGTGTGSPLASPPTVARFLAPGTDGQAFGWWTRDFGGRIACWHSGFTGTRLLVQPSSGRVVVLLTSRLAADRLAPPDVGPAWADVLDAI